MVFRWVLEDILAPLRRIRSSGAMSRARSANERNANGPKPVDGTTADANAHLHNMSQVGSDVTIRVLGAEAEYGPSPQTFRFATMPIP